MTSDTIPARGRPRDADRTEAILDATKELLQTTGYDSLRVADVAEQAGCGLATIYRRWSTKEELVAAAISRPEPEPPTTDDPRADLAALIRDLAGQIGQKSDFLAGFMSAARAHPEIHDAVCLEVRDRLQAQLRRPLGELLGSDNPQIGLIIDAIPGILLHRSGLMGEPVDADAYADEILALVDALG